MELELDRPKDDMELRSSDCEEDMYDVLEDELDDVLDNVVDGGQVIEPSRVGNNSVICKCFKLSESVLSSQGRKSSVQSKENCTWGRQTVSSSDLYFQMFSNRKCEFMCEWTLLKCVVILLLICSGFIPTVLAEGKYFVCLYFTRYF